MANTSPTVPKLFDIPACARVLDVSDGTVRGLIKAGKLRASRVGIQYRISTDAIEIFLAENAVPAAG